MKLKYTKGTSYPILTQNGYKMVTGYTANYNGIVYGIHKSEEPETKNLWVTTDLATGCWINREYTLKASKEALEEYLEEITNALLAREERRAKLNKQLNSMYNKK